MIQIVLENCEVLTFQDRDCAIYLDGIGRHYYGKGSDHQTVRNAMIMINYNAEPELDEDWGTDDWRKRLEVNDITQIWIDNDCYFVDWCADSDYTNAYQTTTRDGLNMYCIISRTRKVPEDF